MNYHIACASNNDMAKSFRQLLDETKDSQTMLVLSRKTAEDDVTKIYINGHKNFGLRFYFYDSEDRLTYSTLKCPVMDMDILDRINFNTFMGRVNENVHLFTPPYREMLAFVAPFKGGTSKVTLRRDLITAKGKDFPYIKDDVTDESTIDALIHRLMEAIDKDPSKSQQKDAYTLIKRKIMWYMTNIRNKNQRLEEQKYLIILRILTEIR